MQYKLIFYITLFCIHGNHEERPFNIGSYKEVEWHGGKVYVEEEFDNREQTEISRFYERMPKPGLIAEQEMLDGKIYFRNPREEKKFK